MYLIKAVETYRADSEAEANRAIEEAKKDDRFELIKYEATKKEKKSKGEVIDEWTRVTLHKAFNTEAEPTAIVDVNYNIEQTVFPEDEGDFPEVEDETTATYEGGF